MISYLYKTMSLNSLRSTKPSGQIATLLMLIMVAVLIFVLVTVNIGQISVTTTNLSNAADAASLYLASQLGTKSRMLSDALRKACGKPTKCCTKTGWGGIIGGIFGAGLGILLAPFTFGASLALTTIGNAVIGGTIGGAIGGAIAGPGALQGAIQGFSVGLAIGGAVTSLGGPAMYQVTPATVGSTELAGVMTQGSTLMVANTPLALLTSTGGIVGTTLAAGASIYNAYIADKITQAAFSAAAKALNGLPQAADRFREGVFLQALSQTVDDPNMHIDEFDSDEDGDIEEKVPYFQYWWERRIANAKTNLAQLKTLIDEFFNGKMVHGEFQAGPAKVFRDFIAEQYAPGGALSRQELDGVDGSIILLARGLEDAGYDLSFYKSGTPPEHTKTTVCTGEDCPEQEEDKYYDSVDRVVTEFKEIIEAIDTWGAESLNQLVDQWEDWMGFLYDPDKESDEDGEGQDYRDSLKDLAEGTKEFAGLDDWKKEFKKKRGNLPKCVYGPCGADGTGSAEEVCNPPCRLTHNEGTIDNVADDEFKPAIKDIEQMMKEIEDFRKAVKHLYNKIQNAIDDKGTYDAFGGKNPIEYAWADTRCPKDANGKYTSYHIVKIETNRFKVPRLKTKHHSDEVCMVLENATGRPWVQITRTDPADKNMGILGKWNPLFNGQVVRKSVAHYRYDNVCLDKTE